MERTDWRNDQLFLTSMLLGVSSHVMYFLSTDRNAWHEVRSRRYRGRTSLHFSLEDAKKTAEKDRVQGTVFFIEQMPVLAFRCRTGIAFCAETHSTESFNRLDWDGEMEFLKIGAAMPDVMDVFASPDASAWDIPRPDPDSFVTRVFDLVGNVDPNNGKTSPVDTEPLEPGTQFSRWKSHPNGTGYNLGWTVAESSRKATALEKVIERFNSLNSSKLKLAANGLFVAAENFVKCHAEENWIPPDLELEAALHEVALRFPNLFPQHKK
jgi:hypothetical protein